MIKLINDDILKADFSDLPPVNVVITSPPYNVGIRYNKHVDTMIYKEYLAWCELWIKKMFDIMADDGRICINIPFSVTPEHLNKKKGDDDINYPMVADYTLICERVGFRYYRTIIWDKNHSNKTCWGSWRSASAPFMRDPSEAILVFYKNRWKRKHKGTSTISSPNFMSWTKNVWKMFPEMKSNHPAPFPIELPKRCVKLFSYKEDLICDPFLGGGTSGEAAVRLERSFVGVEMSQEYFQNAKERIERAEMQTNLSKTIMPNPPIDHKEDAANVW